jgi:hypothetical protein
MNRNNPAIKRIMADMRELKDHPSSRYSAEPLENDMFEVRLMNMNYTIAAILYYHSS